MVLKRLLHLTKNTPEALEKSERKSTFKAISNVFGELCTYDFPLSRVLLLLVVYTSNVKFSQKLVATLINVSFRVKSS